MMTLISTLTSFLAGGLPKLLSIFQDRQDKKHELAMMTGFVYAWRMGTDFQIMLDYMWDEDTQIIWSSVIAFWFGTQAFSKK